MAKTAIELRQERVTLINNAREILERAQNDNRDLHADEKQQYDRIMKDVQNKREQYERLEAQEQLEEEISNHTPNPAPVNPQAGGKPPGAPVNVRATDDYRNAFTRFLQAGQFSNALQVSTDDDGGYTVASEQFVSTLIKAVDNMVFIRGLATKFTVDSAKSMGAPSLDNDPEDADWTSEIREVDEDTSLSFGKRELSPNLLTKLIKVSMKMLRSSSLNAEQLVAMRMAYKYAVTQEKAFLTGSGAGQPLGVFTASNSGISTARDIATGNTATSITFDGLKSAKWSLKSQYHAEARWMFHRDGMAQIDKLKDDNGAYIWQASVVQGEPDRVLSFPTAVSEYVPNTFTTGQYVGILGAFSNYWIADALNFSVQRLNEKYATTNQIGFIGRMETDGMPVLEEAFARVKLA